MPYVSVLQRYILYSLCYSSAIPRELTIFGVKKWDANSKHPVKRTPCLNPLSCPVCWLFIFFMQSINICICVIFVTSYLIFILINL